MKKFKLYTHDHWVKYSWGSMNDARFMQWDVRRCHYGDPHPLPGVHERVFYTDTELEHALRHDCREKVAFMLESRAVTPGPYDFLEKNIHAFDAVLTHSDDLVRRYPGKCIYYPHGNCLIRRDDFRVFPKSRLVSFISSLKNMPLDGHRMRHAFHRLCSEGMPHSSPDHFDLDQVEMFGRLAANEVEYKLDSLKDFRFQVVVENSVLDTYFTEKIIDCFVTGTIPIYFGTTRVSHHFDQRGILFFSTLEQLCDIVSKLTPEMYAERLEAVENNFKRAQKYIVPEDWIYENTDIFNLDKPIQGTVVETGLRNDTEPLEYPGKQLLYLVNTDGPGVINEFELLSVLRRLTRDGPWSFEIVDTTNHSSRNAALFRRAGLIIGMTAVAYTHLMYAAVGTRFVELGVDHEQGHLSDDGLSVRPPEGHELAGAGGLIHHLVDAIDEGSSQRGIHVNCLELESLVQDIIQTNDLSG